MAIRPILCYPDPRLKTVCEAIEATSLLARQVVADLQDTLASVVGSGVAAPQIGELVRVIVIDSSRVPKYAADSHGPMAMVNPEIVASSGIKRFREGCLSLPEFTATVKRAKTVTVRYEDLGGTTRELTTTGFEAVLVQHEIDHLDGILFIDRAEAQGFGLRLRDE